MASIATANSVAKEHLSFAKVAAAASASASPSPAKHKKLVQLAGDPSAPESPLTYMPGVADDNHTTLSSSSDSNKPPSVASGTTFALDEKDSLRPDDSASVKAGEDEEPSGSRMGSDVGVSAFRNQLQEISSMEPSRRGVPQPPFAHAPKGVLYVPPQGPGIGAVPNASRSPPGGSTPADGPPDQKLLEALENPRDRVWVLKLEQDVIDFVKDAKEASLTLPQCHAFYRLLAHKMADYYMLGHLVDDSTSAVRLFKTPNCRIPPPLTGITAPSTAASTPPPSAPKMTILQRGSGPATTNGSNTLSNSENDSDDDKKKKGPVTREQREAQYEAARLRIMGSAKPGETLDALKDQQESRSSSAAGKKHKKKPRDDSDDGFEARSAYSNFYTTSFGSEGLPTSQYGYSEYSDPAAAQYTNGAYPQQGQAGGHAQSMHGQSSSPWAQQPYQTIDPTQAWAQGQSGAYDLSNDFQRMSFQNQIPAQNQGSHHAQNYTQQYYGPPQGWPQQTSSQPHHQALHHQSQAQYPMQGQMPPPSYAYGPHYTPPSGQMHDQHQPYPFGQLPSQTFPGRPSSYAEHPLPGSYKSKHFNPQSQSFIPSQADGQPFTPQGAAPIGNGFANFNGVSQPFQRQNSSSHSQQSSTFGSPHHHNPTLAATMQNRAQTQQLTHPLPQGPVYPRQPSPSVPLPPKPAVTGGVGGAQQQPFLVSSSPQLQGAQGQNQSLLAKWGAPSSLPAKPPPSNEPFDSSRLTQIQRQPFNVAAVARQPGGIVYPGYGTGMVRRND